jgi:hypothetical protein
MQNAEDEGGGGTEKIKLLGFMSTAVSYNYFLIYI